MLRVKVNNEFSDLLYHCSDGISGPLEAGFSSETDIDTVTNVMTSPQQVCSAILLVMKEKSAQ